MSNLGKYQTMTWLAKKVGGPDNLAVLTMAAGVGIWELGKSGVKKVRKVIKIHRSSSSKVLESIGKVYSVTSFGESNEGVIFTIGSQYRVLEIDGDSVLIEKIGDNNNPYFVSAEFLSSISNFKNE